MKTNYFKKSFVKNNSQFIEMSKEELKSIQGGLYAVAERLPDGSIVVIVRL